jgi:hypothetical protein
MILALIWLTLYVTLSTALRQMRRRFKPQEKIILDSQVDG